MITITITSDMATKDKSIIALYLAEIVSGLSKSCRLYTIKNSGEIVSKEIITKSSPLLVESSVNIVDSDIPTDEWRPFPGDIK